MANRRAGKTNAQALEQSRNALLRAGVELLGDEANRQPFSALHVRTICRQAEYSTGAFYVHWPEASDYFDELSTFLLSAGGGSVWASDMELLTEHARGCSIDDPWSALVGLAELDFDLLIAKDEWDAIELFTVTWGRTRFRAEAKDGYRAVDGQTGAAYGVLLARLGRKPRPPFELDTIATVLQGLIEGLGLRQRVDPEAIELPGSDGSRPSPSIYPVAAATLLGFLTTSEHDDRKVPEIARESMQFERLS
jgi:AcrR family transcriptional regulator